MRDGLGRFIKGEHSSPETEFKKGLSSWNKGTKGIMKSWNKGKKCPQISQSLKGRKLSEGTKLKLSELNKGEKSPRWKGGIFVNNPSGYFLKKTKEWRIKNKEKYRLIKKRISALRRIRIKNGEKLTLKIVQEVYEDNIKQYGTLTCYLCFKSIPFGKDHLEHKIPISRGGTNIKENLGIAHQRCNNKKYNKTENEFREVMKNG